MVTKVICPDCGGTVGGQAGDIPAPCRCFDDFPNPSGASTVIASPAGGLKVCRVCGKDLQGKKRFKDSTGYWCEDCHRADKNGGAKEARCSDCSRMFPATKLITYDTLHLCVTCHRERLRVQKSSLVKLAATRGHSLYEQKRILTLLGVFVLLLLIVIMHQLGWF